MKLVKPLARKAAKLFGLTASEEAMLNEVPYRGSRDAADRPAALPLLRTGDGQRPGLEGADRGRIRRRHHVGDRFRHDFEREPDPKGDRVKIVMSGKFLPYKYYGNEQGIPTTGTKES